jgi:hypothetical protein
MECIPKEPILHQTLLPKFMQRQAGTPAAAANIGAAAAESAAAQMLKHQTLLQHVL